MGDLIIKGSVWIEVSNRLKIGYGRALLLQLINKTNSIAEASRKSRIPYRKAWEMIKEMNEFADKPLVIKKVGGKSGGSTILTSEGKRILDMFLEVDKKFEQFKRDN